MAATTREQLSTWNGLIYLQH